MEYRLEKPCQKALTIGMLSMGDLFRCKEGNRVYLVGPKTASCRDLINVSDIETGTQTAFGKDIEVVRVVPKEPIVLIDEPTK